MRHERVAELEEIDSEGQRCLIVGKDGNTTDLTFGRYSGLVSFLHNEAGIESVELGIYNSGGKNGGAFSAKGDSGSLVWHSDRCKVRIVGQFHSGMNKGGSTGNMTLTAPWLVVPGPDQEAGQVRRLLPRYMVNATTPLGKTSREVYTQIL